MTRAQKPEDIADGRSRRGALNRERIVKAMLELVREGELLPTAAEVAARAKVGARSVFRHFADMESLYAELGSLIEREVLPLAEAALPTGSREERVRAMVRKRAAIFERIAPFQRAGAIQRWHSEFLQRDHAAFVRQQRRELLKGLPELGSAPDALVEAVDLATSYEAWDRLRSDQRLRRERAEEAVETAVRALLEAL